MPGQQRKYIRLKGTLMDLSCPRVLGILNVTPDSFYEKSRVEGKEIIKKAEKMILDGADILDVGAVSTRPGAVMPSEDEEWQRLQPALQALVKAFPEAPISVDTWRPGIAEKALDMGAAMINDISGGTFETGMADLAARYQVPVVIMHTSGPPHIMQQRFRYQDVVKDVLSFLISQALAWERAGVRDVIVDPGIGFGKTFEHNFELIASLELFTLYPWPVLVGLSRKRFIRETLGVSTEEALNGSTALHMAALMKGTSFLRVHDVREAVECVKLFLAMKDALLIR
jgi:dihydropteroate synthase